MKTSSSLLLYQLAGFYPYTYKRTFLQNNGITPPWFRNSMTSAIFSMKTARKNREETETEESSPRVLSMRKTTTTKHNSHHTFLARHMGREETEPTGINKGKPLRNKGNEKKKLTRRNRVPTTQRKMAMPAPKIRRRNQHHGRTTTFADSSPKNQTTSALQPHLHQESSAPPRRNPNTTAARPGSGVVAATEVAVARLILPKDAMMGDNGLLIENWIWKER